MLETPTVQAMIQALVNRGAHDLLEQAPIEERQHEFHPVSINVLKVNVQVVALIIVHQEDMQGASGVRTVEKRKLLCDALKE
jgi:hypothetical protein